MPKLLTTDENNLLNYLQLKLLTTSILTYIVLSLFRVCYAFTC